MKEQRVTFGELVRLVERIDDRTVGMAATLVSVQIELAALNAIHPDHTHRNGHGTSTGFAKTLAAIGTIVFSTIAAIATAIASVHNGGSSK